MFIASSTLNGRLCVNATLIKKQNKDNRIIFTVSNLQTLNIASLYVALKPWNTTKCIRCKAKPLRAEPGFSFNA